MSHDPYAPLRVPEFRLFLIARLAMTMAFQMQEVIIGWTVYALTKDPLALGLVGLIAVLPEISVSLYAGHISDRKDRKVITLTAMGVLMGLAVLFLVLSSNMHQTYSRFGVLPIYAILFCAGISFGFLSPSISAFGLQLLPEELYANASSWRSSTWQTGAIAGPALGGLLYGFIGPTWSFAVVLLFFVIAITCMAMIPSKGVPKLIEGETLGESLKKGIQFVFRNQVIVGALSLDLFAVLFGGAVAMLPFFASDILMIGPTGFGILRAAPSIGAVVVALWMTQRPLKGFIGKKLFFAVMGFGLTIIVFGFSRNVYLSLAMLALGGAFDSVSVVIRSTLLNLSTPNEMRGRVEAVNMMFIGSSNEIGWFESGVAAKILGLVPSVVFGGIMTLVSVGVTSKVAPVLRNLRYEDLLHSTKSSEQTSDDKA